MKLTTSTLLRLGLGIMFVWVALLIWQSPEYWSGFLPSSAMSLTGLSASTLIMGNMIFDLVIGAMLIFNIRTHWAALLAALHMAGILIFSGVGDVTVRDIGLLGASLALLVETMPASWKKRLS